jgi:hypothetical protein
MASSAIRTPKKFSSTFISKHFFIDHYLNYSLDQINYGECYDWAYIAHRLFGVQLWSTDYHAWVEVWKERKLRPGEPAPHNRMHWPLERKWFDSETVRGVRGFEALGSHKRFGNQNFPVPWDNISPRAMTPQEFKELWNDIGAGHTFHWESLLETRLVSVLGKKYKASTPILQIKP